MDKPTPVKSILQTSDVEINIHTYIHTYTNNIIIESLMDGDDL